MIRLKNVSKFYYSKGIIAAGFTKVNLELNIGEFVAITGESGSGKSTLLNVISGLDTYEEGEMFVNGNETSHYLEKDWEDYRRKNIGNIYQNFNLINSYTVYQNIEIVLTLNGVSKKERKQKVLELLKRVSMEKYKSTKVSKLSGGQKQRVAIARALAKDVPVIIADEPTGSLDKNSANNIIKLLKEISEDKLVVIVTHNYEQVAEYVTRKITMHDGRIIEDRKIKDIETKKDYVENEYKNIKYFDKVKLGFRNTFNVVSKFILLFLVYSFIVVALMGEYSSFKHSEYESDKLGMNYVFMDTNDHRIIINKKDHTSFTKDEIETIKNMKNVDYTIENDVVVDQYLSLVDTREEYWLQGTINTHSNIRDKVDIGRLPKNDNEIVIEGNKDNYIISSAKKELLNRKFYMQDAMGNADKSEEYEIVGIKYTNSQNSSMIDVKLYVSDKVLKKLLFQAHETTSDVIVNFMGLEHKSNPYSSDYKIQANDWVPAGHAYVSEDLNMYCMDAAPYNCKNKTLNVRIKNIYFESSKDLYISNIYTQKNIKKILNLPNYNEDDYYINYNGIIYVNPSDYNSLFDRDTYQMSVYVKDIYKIKDTLKELDNNYNTLAVKDTLVTMGVTEFLKIIKLIVTIVLVIVLFFISYFVIKIILKSRNVYFSIIRMLGASKKVCKDLLIIELFIISNLSYFIFILIAEINKTKYLNIGFINTVNTYFKLNDYITLYIIISAMSILISMRYARKLFKTSAMKAYREEV